MRIIFLVLSVFLPLQSHAIFGGFVPPAPLNGRTLVVRIRPAKDLGHSVVCSAVIIDSKILITAAHCTEDFQDMQSLVVMDPKNDFTSHNTVTQLLRHPLYKVGFKKDPTLDKVGTDIAVIRLAHPISFQHGQAALTQHQIYPANATLIANGSTEKSATSSNLALNILIQPDVNFLIPHLFYEAPKEGSGPCSQDSGGGIFFLDSDHYVLSAIQSTKTDAVACGDVRSKGFAVPIEENLSWLLPAIQKVEATHKNILSE